MDAIRKDRPIILDDLWDIGIFKKLITGDLPELGTTIKESEIYQYVETLHVNGDDFEDGDIGDRIEESESYVLKKVLLSDLDLEEWYFDEEVAEEYAAKYVETNYIPPIVVSAAGSIVDGTHRANSVRLAGKDYILAFVGS